ncbi:MAG: hypothetical protein M1839_004989 [Geoglossum umbratile]|nr:MAG: hypothetical protein M1839_004989 [Geoglossum umbratile]
MPVHHVTVRVPPAKYDETVSFYLKALAPLDYVEIMRFEGVVGLGAGGIPDFWISTREGANEKGETHVAFSSKERALVNRFHEEGLKAGAKCNGPPGPRPQYTPTYYAAFVLDPVGNNIECCCNCPVEAAKTA